MRLDRGLKFAGMLCICGTIMMANPFVSQAGPATQTTTEMVAKIDAVTVAIYADQNEGSAVVAQASKGATYDVLENGAEGWVKVDIGDSEGYLKVTGNATLAEITQTQADAEAAAQADTSVRQQVVDYALQFVGGRYRYGGSDPHTGVDCSGFTRYVLQNAGGVSMNRSSGSQAVQGRSISAAEIQPGDLVFYGNGSRINHVGLYIGNGQIVHASTERTGIKTSNWTYRNPVKIVSVLG